MRSTRHALQPMLIRHEALCALIPHHGAMCLLDSVTFWDANHIECETGTHRAPNNPLLNHGQLGVLAGLEYGAQAMAVHGGLIAHARQDSARPAYLAAIQDARFHVQRLDDIHGALRIRAELLITSGENCMYRLEIAAGERVLLTARASVMAQRGSA